MTAAFQLKD